MFVVILLRIMGRPPFLMSTVLFLLLGGLFSIHAEEPTDSSLIESIEKNDLKEFREQINEKQRLNQWTEEGVTPLIAAVQYGRLEMVQALLKAGADPNQADEHNQATPILWGAIQDPGEETREKGMTLPTEQTKIQIVRLLLESGARINEKNAWGGSALQWAADAGLLDMVKLLIQKGADINAIDMDGFTPLIAAANYDSEQHNQILKALLDSGAKIDAISKNGDTALMYAIHNFKTDNARTLVKAGANINCKNHLGITPLMKAAQLGRLEIAKYLISAGADINAVDARGKTVLAVAKEAGYRTLIEILVDHGAKDHL